MPGDTGVITPRISSSGRRLISIEWLCPSPSLEQGFSSTTSSLVDIISLRHGISMSLVIGMAKFLHRRSEHRHGDRFSSRITGLNRISLAWLRTARLPSMGTVLAFVGISLASGIGSFFLPIALVNIH